MGGQLFMVIEYLFHKMKTVKMINFMLCDFNHSLCVCVFPFLLNLLW